MRHKILIIFCLLLSTQAIAKNIHIVTTIKPLESLVSNIIDADDSVFSIIDKNNSPHNFALKPSHIIKIHNSDAVIVINPDFETFMRSSFKVIPEKSTIITLSNTPNIDLYPTLHYGSDDKSHQHNSTDYHIWLSPSNATKVIHYITAQLSMINPEKKAIYQKNSELAVQKISMLDAQLKTQLLPLQGKPFMVFHNAYQYFIKHYNLNLSGTITDNPAAYSSVKRIKKAQKQLYDNHVQCVFKEPQFSSKPIETVIAHSKTKIGMLDPLGGGLVSGKNHYFDLMKNLGRDLTKCLEQ